MAKVISENDLGELVFELAKNTLVYAPVLAHKHSVESRFRFEKIVPGSNIALNYSTTILPPKEFLLPPSDVLFSFKDNEAKSEIPDRSIIFGLTYEDLAGVDYLTKIFSAPYSDVPYKDRVNKTILCAIDRFSPPKDIPFDLYIMKISPGMYAGFAGTKEGQGILKSRLFKNQPVNIPRVQKKKDDLILDPKTYEAINKSPNHPVWGELAEICFGCGICSFACPLCYCFEEEDACEIGSDENPKGTRCRTWDSCMLPHFAETTAGNFRLKLEKRIYNWYFHKFVRMPREYGFPGCVDCNRCVIYCPAKINYRKVLERVRSDYEKKGK
jgi:sulfhydrogenase subunit beta (sulfur reductase)